MHHNQRNFDFVCASAVDEPVINHTLNWNCVLLLVHWIVAQFEFIVEVDVRCAVTLLSLILVRKRTREKESVKIVQGFLRDLSHGVLIQTW